MISQIFLLSPRGDTIIFRDFKGNVPKTATEIFFRKVKFWDGQGRDAPPVFQVEGVQYIHICVGGLYWVATTRENVSPSMILELLLRIYWIARDYCGTASEEAVRKNFLLVYELLDEIVDYGFPQNSSTARLRQFVVMDPVIVRPASGRVASGAAASGPSEVIKSVLDTERTGAREEIFVDIVEKLTAIFDAGGHLKTSSIVGTIQVKSYLTGNPPIRLGLNENVLLGGRSSGVSWNSSLESGASATVLDTYSLHGDVDAQKFERDRILELVPPDGHFVALSYRSSRSFRPPFRVYPQLEDDAHTAEKMTLYVRLRAENTKTATAVEVCVPLPKGVERVHCECTEGDGAGSSGGMLLSSLPVKTSGTFEQHAEWRERGKSIMWTLKNLKGGREVVLRARLTMQPGCSGVGRREYGPITLQFVLPGKPSASGLDVKYLKILKGEKGYNPHRWFRVVALSNSYQIRPQM